MRLGPNGDQAKAKRRQKARLFGLISSKLKHLQVVFANLSGLQRRCGEPRAKSRHRCSQPKRHAAASGFCAAARWQSDRSVMLTHVVKLRKIFRRKAARRKCFVGHARKLNNVPEIAADEQLCE
jgi:hypothetical protein